MNPDPRFGERAMQMICAVVSGGRPLSEQYADINRVVDAWVFRPETLLPSVMIEDLPDRSK